jgi:hypothetical protein
LKLAERKSKKDIIRSYGQNASKTTSTEGTIVTQTMIEKLTVTIKELRKTIKKNIQIKNEYFSTKVTTQKQIDLLISSIKVIEIQIKNIKTFISETETTIENVETKIKEEIATKKVIETQKEAFKAAQKKTEVEEELNQVRIVTETTKTTITTESKECKIKFDKETS